MILWYNRRMADLDLSLVNIAMILLLGLMAGTLGGMLGVGGSVILIPGLLVLFGERRAGTQYRTRQIFHGTQGAVWLGRCLALLLVYVIWVNIRRLSGAAQRAEDETEPLVSPVRGSIVGGIMGFIAGLTGVGGGAMAVPLQQVILRLPLRNCIANSSVVICASALVGSIYKNATLYQHCFDCLLSLSLALLVAPTCVLGGYLGAILTHKLPVRAIRVAFIGLMLVAIWKMAAIA